MRLVQLQDASSRRIGRRFQGADGLRAIVRGCGRSALKLAVVSGQSPLSGGTKSGPLTARDIVNVMWRG